MTVAVAFVVPSGRSLPSAVVDAVRRFHPDWIPAAIWCGDPHLKALSPVAYLDDGVTEPSGAGWGRLLVGLDPRAYEWARCAASVQAAFAADDALEAVVVLWAGNVGVLGRLDPLVDSTSDVTLVPRLLADIPLDGLAPTDADVASSGRFFSTVAVFRPQATPALRWIGERVVALTPRTGRHDAVGGLLDRFAETFDVATVVDETVGVGWWRSTDRPPVLVDLEHVDPDMAWLLDAADGRRPRTKLSNSPALARAMETAAAQCSPAAKPLRLPGGVEVDETMRSLMNESLSDGSAPSRTLPPMPFGAENSQFVAWLEQPSIRWGAEVGRYWRHVYDNRADLRLAFPLVDSFDQGGFWEWARKSWLNENRTPLLFPGPTSGRRHVASVGHDGSGLNVVGYHAYDFSLGDVVRRLTTALGDAGIPNAPINHNRTGSPQIVPNTAFANEARFATNLVVVNADQFGFLASDYGDTLLKGRRTIGYWFWELETVPAAMIEAIRYVDEIWTGSIFVANAFANVTDKPVSCVPIPVPEPTVSDRSRADFALPHDRFVFLVTFDHFSVTERKNPFAAIEAFRQAFAPDEGPLLVVKTMNGDIRWQNHERVLRAAAGRPDIRVIDEHLDRADQMALLAHADCLVSLHRSEGLGLHCAEAMWLSTPVIASRYSGNLDFMDDSCSILIDVTMVPVANGEGVYPSTSTWAEPDVGQAAEWMRRLANDPELCRRIGSAGRNRMRNQPTMAETAALIAERAHLVPSAAHQ